MHAPKKKQQGMVLIAVLVIAVILTLLISATTAVMQERLTLAETAKGNIQQQAAIDAKLNELIYLVSTQRITPAGVSRGELAKGAERLDGFFVHRVVGDELPMDGTEVQENNLTFSMQNQSGLIPVNNSRAFWVLKWLQGLGLTDMQLRTLKDTLIDYGDDDDWRSPVGAEKVFYERGDLGYIANFLLQSCSELNKVASWQEIVAMHPEMAKQCSINRDQTLNLNAVPLFLWKVLWPNSYEQMQQRRERGLAILTLNDALALEPSLSGVPEPYFGVINGSYFSINIESAISNNEVMVKVGEGNLPPFTLLPTYTQ
ncbi:type II secretion system protein GspK [Aestuariibacter salexigens]|uniref:type II secretion system protein GspK n=1 Tax=Aestuariibacter salexigens TaxID=226010 RepID=UPI00041EBCED|nr:type II secretion system protein GspK [Aestuariibacter salexigens]